MSLLSGALLVLAVSRHAEAQQAPLSDVLSFLLTNRGVQTGDFERDVAAARATGEKFEKVNTIYPNVNDGVEGMYFIQQCVASSKENGAWLPLKHARARK